MAYICTKDPLGDLGIGSAFHVGDGVFVTARHVVENRKIMEIGTSVQWYEPDPNGMIQIHGKKGRFTRHGPNTGQVVRGPLFHPDPHVDVAALVVEGIRAPVVQLGTHLDDWLDDGLVLTEVAVFGFPPVPFVDGGQLVAASGEVNAIVDRLAPRTHPFFLISTMARGGFSGGLAWSRYGFALGLITESSVRDELPPELGFMTVVTVEPIYVCLDEYGITPACQEYEDRD